MSESEKKEFKHSGRNYPLGALNPKDNPKLNKEGKKMKKTFVVVCVVVAWAITLAGAFIMLSQGKQISTLQKELREVKEDVHSLRSQTVALDKKIFRNFICLMADGKLIYDHTLSSERCVVKEVGNKDFRNWVDMSKDLEGWQLMSIRVVGLDEEEGEKLLNLFKENEIGGEKVDAIFNPGSTVGVRFNFLPVEIIQAFDFKKKEKEHDRK